MKTIISCTVLGSMITASTVFAKLWHSLVVRAYFRRICCNISIFKLTAIKETSISLHIEG